MLSALLNELVSADMYNAQTFPNCHIPMRMERIMHLKLVACKDDRRVRTGNAKDQPLPPLNFLLIWLHWIKPSGANGIRHLHVPMARDYCAVCYRAVKIR